MAERPRASSTSGGAQVRATETEFVRTAPDAGLNSGVTMVSSFVYVAVAVRLSARPGLKAFALTVVDSLRSKADVYSWLFVVGTFPSSV